MNIKDRINQVIKSENKTLKELAVILDVPYQSMHNYLRGDRKISVDFLEKLFTQLGINSNWLLTGHGEERINKTERHSSTKTHTNTINSTLSEQSASLKSIADNNQSIYSNIPIYDINVSAGSGSFVENEEQAGVLSLSDTYLRNELNISPKDAIIIFVTGDSMEPTLRSGDPILIDKSINAVIADGIYVLRVDDVVHVKRVQKKIDGSIKIISDNNIYEPFVFDKISNVDINIIGRVVLNIKKM